MGARRDCYNRQIDYLRVSVTDRCNFRCAYCMPVEGVLLQKHTDMLTYEEMLRIIKVLSKEGISKIRLTGGEPLVRKGIVNFISEIAALGTIKDISMTTNGNLLADMAGSLKAAGLNRVNISLDTVDPERFRAITCGADVTQTLKGMEESLRIGLTPVKLNVVLTEFFTESDIAYFINLVHHHTVAVRFIEYMPIGNGRVHAGPSVEKIKSMINSWGKGVLKAVQNVKGYGPARYYTLPEAVGSFGFITPISEHFCQSCNRIRLTADGKFKPCLLSNKEIDVKKALRSSAGDEEIVNLFYLAIGAKQASHTLNEANFQPDFFRNMSQIGG
ncbi:MAG TPA: GTP 3',8-cyclase MoaA [Methylomusa anaerophila]|uniref:GTP 3',8-cyclase n=1 Tax=Methylomusa anaerophila TaxID=1930071 RepID=A0A348ANM1_9FIRM|nr:GTP 3',8-cyclase MoaA [Methylomusa anaerophila]BBB92669.1 cyclic pyranopterin monophosphate synthase [Methylomusa anaerophila]HML87478.1 GTP 3',8-cyclase MoaA [Methylomusa anaerophila]